MFQIKRIPMYNYEIINVSNIAIYFCKNPDKLISDEELMDKIVILPYFRKTKALEFRFMIDRKLSFFAYDLTRIALEKEHKIITNMPWSYKDNHKPYLKEYLDVNFNVSHCKDMVASAVSCCNVGIDVESFIDFDEDLVRHIANDKEYYAIKYAVNPSIELTRLWTQKESYLKFKGWGLVDNLRDLFDKYKYYSIETIIFENCVMSICF